MSGISPGRSTPGRGGRGAPRRPHGGGSRDGTRRSGRATNTGHTATANPTAQQALQNAWSNLYVIPDGGNQTAKANDLFKLVATLVRKQGTVAAGIVADAIEFGKPLTRVIILGDHTKNPCLKRNEYLKPNNYLVRLKAEDKTETKCITWQRWSDARGLDAPHLQMTEDEKAAATALVPMTDDERADAPAYISMTETETNILVNPAKLIQFKARMTEEVNQEKEITSH
jgi:hypothetical protein